MQRETVLTGALGNRQPFAIRIVRCVRRLHLLQVTFEVFARAGLREIYGEKSLENLLIALYIAEHRVALRPTPPYLTELLVLHVNTRREWVHAQRTWIAGPCTIQPSLFNEMRDTCKALPVRREHDSQHIGQQR